VGQTDVTDIVSTGFQGCVHTSGVESGSRVESSLVESRRVVESSLVELSRVG
jgi:hypothetical protein